MDMILLFLAKPLDKHGTTLLQITYPSMIGSVGLGASAVCTVEDYSSSTCPTIVGSNAI